MFEMPAAALSEALTAPVLTDAPVEHRRPMEVLL